MLESGRSRRKVAQNVAEVLIRLQLILLARSLDQEVDDARCRAPIGSSAAQETIVRLGRHGLRLDEEPSDAAQHALREANCDSRGASEAVRLRKDVVKLIQDP